MGLFRGAGVVGGGMDTFFGRLTSACLVTVFVALSSFSGVASASWTGAGSTQAEASAACNADGQALVDQNKAEFPGQVSQANPNYTCVAQSGTCDNNGWLGCYILSFYVYGSTRGGGVYGWGVQDAPPKNPCASLKPRTYFQAGKILSGMQSCIATPQPDGSSVQCGFTFQPSGNPISASGGAWNTRGTMTYTGDVCGASQGSGQGSGWQDDGNQPVQPQPPPPSPPSQDAADPAPSPKVCGSVSCYKPDTGQYCTQGSSGEICAAGAPPNASSGGSCATNGDTTICAGTPQAPKPPANKVPDPPTQTRGTDNFDRADPSTGDIQHVTTTTYTTGDSVPTNGAKAGDLQPKPASSSTSGGSPSDKKDDGTGASGGGDCSNPPNVEGSAALGMVALQAWHTRCDVGSSVDSVGKGMEKLNATADKIAAAVSPDAPTDDVSMPKTDDAWSNGKAGSSGAPISGDSIADNANNGVYNESGMGFDSACPMHDLVVPIMGDVAVTVPLSLGCPVGAWIRGIVIGFALFAAARITAGGAS